jgi:hypothetical protein
MARRGAPLRNCRGLGEELRRSSYAKLRSFIIFLRTNADLRVKWALSWLMQKWLPGTSAVQLAHYHNHLLRRGRVIRHTTEENVALVAMLSSINRKSFGFSGSVNFINIFRNLLWRLDGSFRNVNYTNARYRTNGSVHYSERGLEHDRTGASEGARGTPRLHRP